jgi:hypothetical protein
MLPIGPVESSCSSRYARGECNPRVLAEAGNSTLANPRVSSRGGFRTRSGGRPGSRTRMGYPTRPSNVRVYQFRQPPGCSRMILPGGSLVRHRQQTRRSTE